MNSVFYDQVSSYIIGEMPQQVFDNLLATDKKFNDWVEGYEAIDLVERAVEKHTNDNHLINYLLENGADITFGMCASHLTFANIRAVDITGGRMLVEAWLLKAKGEIYAS